MAADAIIFDLEDAVAPEEKAAARDVLARLWSEGGYGAARGSCGSTGLDSPWGAEDLAAFGGHPGVEAVLIPKVNRAADLDVGGGGDRLSRLWAMMETALGMLNAAEIAAHPRLAGHGDGHQ